MAFYIEADTIYITKGDDAVLEISGITAQDSSQYELQAEDVLTLTVRELPSTVTCPKIDSTAARRRGLSVHAQSPLLAMDAGFDNDLRPPIATFSEMLCPVQTCMVKLYFCAYPTCVEVCTGFPVPSSYTTESEKRMVLFGFILSRLAVSLSALMRRIFRCPN